MSEFFEWNCIAKWVIFFAASFCWLWNFLLENLKSKRNSAVQCNVWMSIKKMKKLYARNNLFKKRIPNMRYWNIYILVQISFFLGTSSRRFSQYFVLIFCRQPTIVAGGWHFYSASKNHLFAKSLIS